VQIDYSQLMYPNNYYTRLPDFKIVQNYITKLPSVTALFFWEIARHRIDIVTGLIQTLFIYLFNLLIL